MINAVAPERWSYRVFLTKAPFAFLFLTMMLCTPSAVAFLAQGGSHSPGLVAASVVVLLMLVPVLRVRLRYDILGAFLLFLLIHFFVARQIAVTSTARFVGSLALVMLLFAMMTYYAQWLVRLTPHVMDRAVRYLALFLVLVTLMAVARLQPLGGGVWEKPTFPFTEPSHFAAVFTPVLLALCSRPGGRQRFLWLGIGLLSGAVLQNLTVLVGVALVIAITAPFWQFCVVLLLGTAAATQIDLTYYLSRLDFSVQTQNLSALVYLQGIDFIEQSFVRTWGWGVGFQQLGFTPLHSPATLVIYSLNSGSFLNLQDGGFVATKAISELGIFGVMLIATLTVVAVRAALILRRSALNGNPLDPRRRFCLAILAGYLIDIYVRGVGYFSATTIFLGIAVFALSEMRRANVTDAWQSAGAGPLPKA